MNKPRQCFVTVLRLKLFRGFHDLLRCLHLILGRQVLNCKAKVPKRLLEIRSSLMEWTPPPETASVCQSVEATT